MLPGMSMAAPMSLAAAAQAGPFHPMAAAGLAAAAAGMMAKVEENKPEERNTSRASRPRSNTPETSQATSKRPKVLLTFLLERGGGILFWNFILGQHAVGYSFSSFLLAF